MPEIDLREDRARPSPRPSLGTLDRCPVCGGGDLDAVSDGESVNFRCRRCDRCWHVELNRVTRVDPDTCGGCPRRDGCRARFAADRAGRAGGDREPAGGPRRGSRPPSVTGS